jgi:antitoxin MazE
MAVKTIRKWGNSLGVLIPRSVAQKANLEEGTPVTVEVHEGKVVLEAAVSRYQLDDLLAEVTQKNRHAETDTGHPEGKELW